MSDFHPHGVVGRDSETQLQVCENLNYLIPRFKAQINEFYLKYAQSANATVDLRLLTDVTPPPPQLVTLHCVALQNVHCVAIKPYYIPLCLLFSMSPFWMDGTT